MRSKGGSSKGSSLRLANGLSGDSPAAAAVARVPEPIVSAATISIGKCADRLGGISKPRGCADGKSMLTAGVSGGENPAHRFADQFVNRFTGSQQRPGAGKVEPHR